MSDRARRRRAPRRPGVPAAAARDAPVSGALRTSDVPAWGVFAALLAALLLAYHPAWHGGMLWDDDGHLTRASLRSLHGLWQIWFEIGATQQYYPLTHSVFWIEHALWGDATLGYHLVNIALHALSATLLYVTLRRLGARGAIVAAAIFALHPMQVESVAWMTELKNTLAGVFYFGAALAYVRFDEERSTRSYVLAFALFVLGLLSKTVVATLPAALLAAIWWRRGALGWRRDLLPTLPLFGAGAAAGLVTAFVERAFIGARGSEFAFSLVERCLIAGRDVWFYLGTILWPAHLMFIYPRWSISASVWWQYVFPLGAVALGIALWMTRGRSRAPLAAYVAFVCTLGPALGFVNVFPFRYSFVADHFAYMAIAGPVAVIAAALVTVASHVGMKQPALIAGVVGALLGLLTWSQSASYVDAETLYRDTIAKNPGCWLCENNLAATLLADGTSHTDDAIAHARAALALRSDYAEAHANLGAALERRGDYPAALAEFEAALAGYSDSPSDLRLGKVYHGIGRMLVQLGRPADALAAYGQALHYEPGSVDVHVNAGVAFSQAGQPDRAEQEFRAALAIDPQSAHAHSDLGAALMQQRKFADAKREFESALQLEPDNPDTHFNLGIVAEQTGDRARALAEFTETLRLDPRCDSCRQHVVRDR
jgi:Flp pilus assembly protein TadD